MCILDLWSGRRMPRWRSLFMVGVADLGRDIVMSAVDQRYADDSGHSTHLTGHATFLWCLEAFFLAPSASIDDMFGKLDAPFNHGKRSFIQRCSRCSTVMTSYAWRPLMTSLLGITDGQSSVAKYSIFRPWLLSTFDSDIWFDSRNFDSIWLMTFDSTWFGHCDFLWYAHLTQFEFDLITLPLFICFLGHLIRFHSWIWSDLMWTFYLIWFLRFIGFDSDHRSDLDTWAVCIY